MDRMTIGQGKQIFRFLLTLCGLQCAKSDTGTKSPLAVLRVVKPLLVDCRSFRGFEHVEHGTTDSSKCRND